MVNVTRSLLVLSILVGAPAFAASQATVGVKIAELRIKPDDGAFSRLKIPGGREVAVLGKSDDGRWIKVRTQIEKGEDIIKLEGWVEAAQLKGADPSSLSVASGGDSGSKASSSTWSDTSSSSSSSGDSWGGESASAPAESAAPAWGDAPASTSTESSSGDAMGEWDLNTPAASEPKAESSSSDSAWDSGSSDSGSSSSGSSGDSWESSDSGSSSESSSADDGGW